MRRVSFIPLLLLIPPSLHFFFLFFLVKKSLTFRREQRDFYRLHFHRTSSGNWCFVTPHSFLSSFLFFSVFLISLSSFSSDGTSSLSLLALCKTARSNSFPFNTNFFQVRRGEGEEEEERRRRNLFFSLSPSSSSSSSSFDAPRRKSSVNLSTPHETDPHDNVHSPFYIPRLSRSSLSYKREGRLCRPSSFLQEDKFYPPSPSFSSSFALPPRHLPSLFFLSSLSFRKKKEKSLLLSSKRSFRRLSPPPSFFSFLSLSSFSFFSSSLHRDSSVDCREKERSSFSSPLHEEARKDRRLFSNSLSVFSGFSSFLDVRRTQCERRREKAVATRINEKEKEEEAEKAKLERCEKEEKAWRTVKDCMRDGRSREKREGGENKKKKREEVLKKGRDGGWRHFPSSSPLPSFFLSSRCPSSFSFFPRFIDKRRFFSSFSPFLGLPSRSSTTFSLPFFNQDLPHLARPSFSLFSSPSLSSSSLLSSSSSPSLSSSSPLRSLSLSSSEIQARWKKACNFYKTYRTSPYPSTYDLYYKPNITIPELLHIFRNLPPGCDGESFLSQADLHEKNTEKEDEEDESRFIYSLSGRIDSIRNGGMFIDLYSLYDEKKIQLFISLSQAPLSISSSSPSSSFSPFSSSSSSPLSDFFSKPSSLPLETPRDIAKGGNSLEKAKEEEEERGKQKNRKEQKESRDEEDVSITMTERRRRRERYPSTVDTLSFLDLGDLVVCTGKIRRTSRGELTLHLEPYGGLQIIAKRLLPIDVSLSLTQIEDEEGKDLPDMSSSSSSLSRNRERGEGGEEEREREKKRLKVMQREEEEKKKKKKRFSSVQSSLALPSRLSASDILHHLQQQSAYKRRGDFSSVDLNERNQVYHEREEEHERYITPVPASPSSPARESKIEKKKETDLAFYRSSGSPREGEQEEEEQKKKKKRDLSSSIYSSEDLSIFDNFSLPQRDVQLTQKLSSLREKLRIRSLIIQTARDCLLRQGYLEVDTSILQPARSSSSLRREEEEEEKEQGEERDQEEDEEGEGERKREEKRSPEDERKRQAPLPTARLFETYCHSMNTPLHLRVSPELCLKRLVLSGVSQKLFEIGRCFRNEGISSRHQPEFLSLEAYSMFSTYEDMISLAEDVIRECAMNLLSLKDQKRRQTTHFLPSSSSFSSSSSHSFEDSKEKRSRDERRPTFSFSLARSQYLRSLLKCFSSCFPSSSSSSSSFLPFLSFSFSKVTERNEDRPSREKKRGEEKCRTSSSFSAEGSFPSSSSQSGTSLLSFPSFFPLRKSLSFFFTNPSSFFRRCRYLLSRKKSFPTSLAERSQNPVVEEEEERRHTTSIDAKRPEEKEEEAREKERKLACEGGVKYASEGFLKSIVSSGQGGRKRWRRVSMVDILHEYTGIHFSSLSHAEALEAVRQLPPVSPSHLSSSASSLHHRDLSFSKASHRTRNLKSLDSPQSSSSSSSSSSLPKPILSERMSQRGGQEMSEKKNSLIQDRERDCFISEKREDDQQKELPEDCYRSIEDLMEWVFKERVEPNLIEPIHILYSPLKLSPLAAEMSALRHPSIESNFHERNISQQDKERRRRYMWSLDQQIQHTHEREDVEEEEDGEGDQKKKKRLLMDRLREEGSKEKREKKEAEDGKEREGERMRYAQRFETYIGGIEVADGYTELTDPIEQLQRFRLQQELSSPSPLCMQTRKEERKQERNTRDIKQDEAKKKFLEEFLGSSPGIESKERREKEEGRLKSLLPPASQEFSSALLLGLPPTAGVGIGLDRLAMILTKSAFIRDVVHLPLRKSLY